MRRSVNGVSEFHDYHHIYETCFANDLDDVVKGVRRKVAEVTGYPEEHQVRIARYTLLLLFTTSQPSRRSMASADCSKSDDHMADDSAQAEGCF